MSLAVAAPSAAETAAAVREGRADPVELAQQALDRVAAVDAELGAFVAVDADDVLRQARTCADGPLRGVPVAVKDLFDVAGQVTRAGSRVPAGPPAEADAQAVARLRAAGAVVVGRTRTHEWAWGITTQHEELGGTRNPWDTARVPGGSSGGSAAAVAAGAVPLALGTDTGCSVRLPAAWCGLVGHKPTWGAVPLAGCLPLAPSMDCGGALVRTVADARLALQVLADGLDVIPAAVRGLRLGVVQPEASGGPAGPVGPGAAVTPAVADALQRCADTAADHGLQVRSAALPLTPEQRLAAYLGVQAREALAWHTATGRWPAHEQAYGRGVRAALRRAAATPPDELDAAADLRTALRAQLAQLLTEVDVLLLPVAGCGPPPVADPDAGPLGSVRAAVLPWSVPANLCGLPACAVPVGADDDGLPVAVQVVGRPGEDGRVLDVAERLFVAPPWG